MSRIHEAFAGKKAFIAYLMGGDPSLALTREYILAMQEAGADLIEVGIPFSDPIAEGEVIQRANIRALEAGTTVDKLFQLLHDMQGEVTVPLVFLTYLNPVFFYGYQRFFARCAECGVSGVIIPDLPFEEQGEARDLAAAHGVDIITLVAPTSKERIGRIAKSSTGFIYLVSSMGVTGVRSEITTDIPAMVAEIKRTSSVPVAVGFGISTPQQAEKFAQTADGVIVGSKIVQIIEEHGNKAHEPLRRYVAEMKESVAQVAQETAAQNR